jgi:hypothetical protein
MASKGLDTGDKLLANAIAQQLIHSLRMQSERGRLVRDGKKGNALIWRLPSYKRKILIEIIEAIRFIGSKGPLPWQGEPS